MDKFRNKYRTSSARLQNWNYGWNAAYFVTICTANRELFFGDIVNGEMKLSEIGAKANEYWLEIPDHFPFVKLDVYVVMPNHVHGIIIIDKQNDERGIENNENHTKDRNGRVGTPKLGVPTASQKWKPATLGVIINQYKRICTIESRKIHPGFAWQNRFYDHIIRDNASYQRIKKYIINNPNNWINDYLKN